MKTPLRWLMVLLVSLFAATASWAQSRFLSQAELDQVLAPIALYPDNVLSQLLMAATYPREVGEAAAWSRANPQLMGEEAVRRIENEPWDPSVKSLVAFPQVLAMMGERMDWTQRLGEAFLSSPELVSDTIQALRRRADQAGNLRSGDEMKVYRDDRYYYIEPPSPEVVYVPYYDPRVVYGRWWWPSYQPVWWHPWHGYQWITGFSGFGWGYGINVGRGFFYSGWDWRSRYIYVHNTLPRYHHGWDQRHGHRGWHDGNRGNWSNRHDGRGDGGRHEVGRDNRGRDRGDGRGDGRRREGAPPAPTSSAPVPNPVHRDASGEAPRYAPRVNGAASTGRGYGHAPAEPQASAPAPVPATNPVARPAPAPASADDRPGGGRGASERSRTQ